MNGLVAWYRRTGNGFGARMFLVVAGRLVTGPEGMMASHHGQHWAAMKAWYESQGFEFQDVTAELP